MHACTRRALRRLAGWMVAACLPAAAARPPAKAAFTLAQVMGSAFPSALTASRRGEHIAWVANRRGVRNIFVANGPRFRPRQVTHYGSDDGQPIRAVRLTPNGRTVVYARGSSENKRGLSADPDHSARQPEQDVWSVRVGGAPRRLGEMGCRQEGCEDIALSPDGRWAVWPARRTLWIAPTDGSRPARPLAWAEGRNNQPQWSPDGREIAFVSHRTGHSLIGVYRLGGRRVRYVAPSVDHDAYPRWSPGGRHLVFVRRRQELPSPPPPGAGPAAPQPARPLPRWELWVANARTLAAHRFWESGTQPQDAIDPNYDGVFRSALRVGAGHQVLFAYEDDGWNHLYAVSDQTRGGGRNTARLLTPGEFEIRKVTLAPGGRTAIYSSNENDVDRRHLWRVGLEGGTPPVAITSGATLEWSPVETGDRRAVLCLGSSATTPAMPYEILPGGARRMLGRLPADFPSRQLVTPVDEVFASAGGFQIHAQLFTPPGAAGGALRPAIVYVHGGPQRQMMLGFNPMNYYHYAYAENEYLASLGFYVLAVNYRGGNMYGWAFRNAPDTGRQGASEYNDVVAAAHFLRHRAGVDPSRIGIWGGSWGGYLTALALARNSNLFAAGVDFHGVHDLSTDYDGAGPPPAPKPTPPGEVPPGLPGNLAFDSSPDAYIREWRSPVLLIQGDDDRNVAFEQMIGLVERLRAQGVPFEQLVFPDETHIFLRWRTWMRSYAATARFFQRVLLEGRTIATDN